MSIITVNKIKIDTSKKYSLPFQKRAKNFKSNNNMLDLENFTAKSYNWWNYVIRIKGKVIFNNHNYSATTNKHQWAMRSLLRELGIKIFMTVNTRKSLTEHVFKFDILEELYTSLYTDEFEVKNSRIRTSTRESLLCDIKHTKEKIKQARKLGAICSKSRMQRIKEDLNERLTRLENERKENSKKLREENKAILQQSKELFNKGEEFTLSL